MKTIVIDLDGTLTQEGTGTSYKDVLPRPEVIAKLREYAEAGFRIAIYTARNMRTHKNNVGVITALTAPVVIECLDRHQVPYDELHVGKPWCGDGGFYVDDKAIRPSEFTRLDAEQIQALIRAEAEILRPQAETQG